MTQSATTRHDDRPGFQRIQYAFTAHIRDPEGRPAPPEVSDDRMAVYRRLVYGNIEGYMAKAFPILRGVYTDADWHAMVRDFFVRHTCHTAQFYRAAEEFLAYLQHERDPRPHDPPFMLELAHYEWLDLMLYILDVSPDMDRVDADADLLAGAPVVSPLAQSVAYRYPVHTITRQAYPVAPPPDPTFLVVYRDLADVVRFLKVNAVTARLLERLSTEPAATGREQLEAIASEMGHPDPSMVIEGGRQTLTDLRARDIVLGVRRAG